MHYSSLHLHYIYIKLPSLLFANLQSQVVPSLAHAVQEQHVDNAEETNSQGLWAFEPIGLEQNDTDMFTTIYSREQVDTGRV